MASKTPIPIALPEDERFYIVRPDQSMVPLVPIDRTYAVEGVPAKLSHEQLSTEHWKFVAHATKSTAAATSDLQTSSSATSASPPTLQYEPAPVSKPGHYGQPYTPSTEQQVATRSFAAASLSQAGLPRQVDPHQPTPQYATPSIVPRTSPPGAYRAPDHDVRIEQASMNRAQPTLAAAIPPVAAPDRESPSWRTNSTHVDGVRSPPVMSAVTKAYSIAAIRFNPRGIPVDHSKKEYCIHWIRTGECDYMPQGCRFKHEMPTLDYLRRTYNIREIPRWHREHHPLMKKTWLQERVANQGSDRADNDTPRQQDLRRPDESRPAKTLDPADEAKEAQRSSKRAFFQGISDANKTEVGDLIIFDDCSEKECGSPASEQGSLLNEPATPPPPPVSPASTEASPAVTPSERSSSASPPETPKPVKHSRQVSEAGAASPVAAATKQKTALPASPPNARSSTPPSDTEMTKATYKPETLTKGSKKTSAGGMSRSWHATSDLQTTPATKPGWNRARATPTNLKRRSDGKTSGTKSKVSKGSVTTEARAQKVTV